MEKKLDDYILMDIVFKSLCRVLKNRKIYHRFRCFLGTCDETMFGNGCSATNIYTKLKCMQPYVYKAIQGYNLFYRATSKNDIFKILRETLSSYDAINGDKDDVGLVQMRITHLLNTLLHSCVERAVDKLSDVEEIGEETFNMVCKAIYGNDFVDETEKYIPDEFKRLIDAKREYIGCNVFDERDLYINPRFREFIMNKDIIGKRTPLRRRRRKPISNLSSDKSDAMTHERLWCPPIDYGLECDEKEYEWNIRLEDVM